MSNSFYDNIEAPVFHDFVNGDQNGIDGDSWFEQQEGRSIRDVEGLANTGNGYDPAAFWGEGEAYNDAASDVSAFEIQECVASLPPISNCGGKSPHQKMDVPFEEFRNTGSKKRTQRRAKQSRVQEYELTVPQSPMFLTKQRAASRNVQKLNAEEKELQQLEVDRRKLQQRLRESRFRMEKAERKAAMASQLKNTKSLTVPQEFEFRAAQRGRPGIQEYVMHEDGKTASPLAPKRQNRMRAPVKEFSFIERERIKKQMRALNQQREQEQSDLSEAERTIKEQNIERERKELAKRMKKYVQETELNARPRRRVMESESSADEEFQRKPFKALPLDRRILQSAGDLGISVLPKKKLTTTMNIRFATDDRIEARKREREEREYQQAMQEFRNKNSNGQRHAINQNQYEEEDYEPKVFADFEAFEEEEAKPKNRRSRLSLTEPRSPKFATDNRMKLRASLQAQDCNAVYHEPVPQHSSERQSNRRYSLQLTVPQSPVLATKERMRLRSSMSSERGYPVEPEEPSKKKYRKHNFELTVPQSPALATKERMKLKSVNQPAQMVEEVQEPVYHFHARPMPDFEKKHLQSFSQHSHSEPIHLTEPQPFHFRTSQRSEIRPRFGNDNFSDTQNRAVDEEYSNSTNKMTKWTGEITQPKPFKFTTTTRTQFYDDGYAAEPELVDRATEFSRKKQNKSNQVYVATKKPLTESKPFVFNSVLRAAAKESLKNNYNPNQMDEEYIAYQLEDDHKRSQQRRLNNSVKVQKRILEPASLTIPQSPFLHTKQRAVGRDF